MAGVLKKWGGLIDSGLSIFEGTFVALAMLGSSALLFANVVFRYFLHAPITWAEELAVYLVIWVVFIGGSAIVRAKSHLAIDLLPRALTPARRRILFLVTSLISVAFFAVLMVYSWQHTMRVYGSGQVTPVMQMPMWLTYLAVPVGSALMIVRGLQMAYLGMRHLSDEGLKSGAME